MIHFSPTHLAHDISHLTIKTVTISRLKLRQLHRFDTFSRDIVYFPWNLAPKGNIRRCFQDTGRKEKQESCYHRSWGFIIHRVGEARSWEKKRKEKKKKRWKRLGEEERGGGRKLKIMYNLDTTNNYQRTVMQLPRV